MSTHDSDHGTGYAEARQQRDDDPVTREEHVSRGYHRMGDVLPYADSVQPLEPGKAGQVGQSEFAAAADHTHNIYFKTLVAAPTDAAFEEPIIGTPVIAIVGANNRLYVRWFDGTWKYVNLT